MAEAVAANVPATTGADEAKKPLFGLAFLENLSEMSMLRQIGLLVVEGGVKLEFHTHSARLLTPSRTRHRRALRP